jgi:putative ABC transport system ATP-binding protein
MIELRDVGKRYGRGAEETWALRDVNLRIAPGERVAIVGPSGSGKTTLLHVLGCLDRTTTGAMLFDGHDLLAAGDRTLTRFRAESLGFVFQSFHLFELFTAIENVEYPLHLLGVGANERRERSQEALRLVGLEAMAKRLPQELSGGEKQRVAVARAIVHRPKLVLADEPTANLDSATGERIVELLGSLNERLGVTLVVATHDTALVGCMERVVSLKDGRLDEGAC